MRIRFLRRKVGEKNSGIIELKLNENLKPYLLQLKEKYTEYELIYPMHFKSKYSIRLYVVFISIRGNSISDISR